MFYGFVVAILRPLVYLFFRPKISGKENVIPQGKCIFIFNHISALDPIIVGCLLPRKLSFMAKAELFRNPILRWIIINLGAFPVKRGAADITAVKKALQLLKDEGAFAIFPEGTRSKTGEMQNLEPGVAMIALKSKAPIIPIVIRNKYKIFRKTYITIGKVIDLSEFNETKANSDAIETVTDQLTTVMKNMLNS